MREWEIGAVENIHGALPYIRFAPILALGGVGVNRIDKGAFVVLNEDGWILTAYHIVKQISEFAEELRLFEEYTGNVWELGSKIRKTS